MKKILFISFFILFFAAILILFGLKKHPKNEYVTLSQKSFILNKKPFFPLVLNYMASLQTDKEGNFWCSAFKDYHNIHHYKYTSKDSCIMQLKAHMDLIKKMGFNTVRVVNVGELWSNDTTGELYVSASLGDKNPNSFLYTDNKIIRQKYFNAINEFFTIIKNAGLKVIFLLKPIPSNKFSDKFLKQFTLFFKNNPTILAIDLYNEPLYFDKIRRTKQDVFNIVKDWNTIVKNSSPRTLTTIGLVGVREVLEWDPNILGVDFVSFHPYNHEKDQVLNEIYWYGKYVKKPWIIGETAIPADNDSISYESQKIFTQKSLNQSYNCNAWGYSWWQFKDVDWKNYHANFMGVLNTKGKTIVNKKDIPVDGTPKPMLKVIQSFDISKKKKPCVCLSNYYNYSKSKDFIIKGYIIDKNSHQPIDGAVIMAWNKDWTYSHHTITKKDGSFKLLCNFRAFSWLASATKYVHIEGFIGNLDSNNINSINLDSLKITPLNF